MSHRNIKVQSGADSHLSWLLCKPSNDGMAIRSSSCSIIIVFYDHCLLPCIPPCEEDDHLSGLHRTDSQTVCCARSCCILKSIQVLPIDHGYSCSAQDACTLFPRPIKRVCPLNSCRLGAVLTQQKVLYTPIASYNMRSPEGLGVGAHYLMSVLALQLSDDCWLTFRNLTIVSPLRRCSLLLHHSLRHS